MYDKLKPDPDYIDAYKTANVVKLLQTIERLSSGENELKYPTRQATYALKQLARAQQGASESLTDWYERFTALVQNLEHTLGEFNTDELAKKIPTYNNAKNATRAQEREKFLACLFMEGGNYGHKVLLRDLEQQHSVGVKQFPVTVAQALQVMTIHAEAPTYKNIMKKHKSQHRKDNRGQDEGIDIPELTFAMTTTGKSKAKILQLRKKKLCFICEQPGHVAKECDNNPDKAAQFAQTDQLVLFNID